MPDTNPSPPPTWPTINVADAERYVDRLRNVTQALQLDLEELLGELEWSHFPPGLEDPDALARRLREALRRLRELAQEGLGPIEGPASPSRPWRVDVLSVDGAVWTTLARFASETDAWVWARRWIDARVFYGAHCQGGVRDGVDCSAERILEERP